MSMKTELHTGRQPKRRSQRSAQSGLTLIELMITVAILGLVIAGALNMGYSLMNGFRYTRTAASVERSGRASLSIIADAVKQSNAGVETGDIIDLSASDSASCETYRGVGNMNGLVITDGDATAPDELTVMHASGGVITSLAHGQDLGTGPGQLQVNDASGFRAGDYALVVANNFQQGLLFRVTSVDATSDPNILELDETVDQLCSGAFTNALAGEYASSAPTLNLVVRAKKSRFYIDTTSFGGVPVLMLDPDGAGPDDGEPIAPGIEDLQIVAGIDGTAATADGEIDPADLRFDVTGETIAVSEIIRALQISLVSRSLKPVSNQDFSSRPTLGNRPAGDADGFLRRTQTTTVEIRNLAGSPGTKL